MPKNSLRKNTFSPLTQKIKAPQHLLWLGDEEGEPDNESSGCFQLPSLPRRKSLKDDDNVLFTDNSVATSASWSQEAENVATQRVEQQWKTVERSFYEEDEQLPPGPVLDECTQWRTQIPYLRLMGSNSADVDHRAQLDDDQRHLSGKTRIKLDNLQNDEVLMERSLSIKEEEDSTQYKLNKAKSEEVLDLMMEHLILELFPDKEDDTDSLHESLSDTLKITPAPLHGNRNSSKNTKTNWAEEAVSPNYIESKSLSIRNRLLDTESSLQTIKNDANYQAVQKRQRNSISANKPRNFGGAGDDDTLKSKERPCASHRGRNKLGTVFNKRIVVTPVPYVASTRESFSTLRTTPIRFMGSAQDMLSLRGSARKSSLRHPDIHSAWQAPVCPAVWPKNVRLAPIDTSRLPSSKNRPPAPAVLHCSRKPLSPIARPTIPKSAQAARERDDLLEIQGKHVAPTPSSKISLRSAGWDYSPRVAKIKKKIRAREGP